MSIQLDREDIRILTILQEDAERPMAEVAESAGLSLSSCWRRVRSLKEAGVIRKTVAILDPQRAGLGFEVIASVTLTDHGLNSRLKFEDFARARPEIVECRLLSGEKDYQMRVVTPDLGSYEHFMTGVLLEQPEVRSVVTSIVLRRVKTTTALPLSA